MVALHTIGSLPIMSRARAIAATGFGEPSRIEVAPEQWSSLLSVIVDQRLTGLAVAAATDGRLQLSPPDRAELLDRHRDAMLRALATERVLAELADDLDASGVSFVVLKGPAVARAAYPSAEWRPFGDLDLLVRGRDWESATRAIRRIGFRRDVPEPRPGFDVRFGKAATHTRRDGLQIDLHRTLTLGPFGIWMDPAAVFEATQPFELAGRRMRRLDDASLFLHACVHAILGWWPPLLLPTRDVAQIADQLAPDPATVRARSRAWRLDAVVQQALVWACDLVGSLPTTDGLADGLRPDRVSRWALRSYTTGGRRRMGMVVSTTFAIPSLTAKAVYVRDMAFPTRAFMEARSTTTRLPVTYPRRWATSVRWLAGRARGR